MKYKLLSFKILFVISSLDFKLANLKSRELMTNKILKDNNLYFIHPSNNTDVILGNSTCTLELIEDYQNLDYIFSPIGGGGLIAINPPPPIGEKI